MEIKFIVSSVLVLITILSCKDKIELKPIKYIYNDESYSCTGIYSQDELQRIVCLNDKNDTTLIQTFFQGTNSSQIKVFYDNGELKEEGQYQGSDQVGIWKSYYPEGEIEYFRYMIGDQDSFNVLYQKHFEPSGRLISSSLPVEIIKDSLPETFKVGNSYTLFINLAYSEFDSVKSIVFLDPAPKSNVSADSVLFLGREVSIDFSPSVKGQHIISGTYFELDASRDYEDELTTAERPFTFQYIAEE